MADSDAYVVQTMAAIKSICGGKGVHYSLDTSNRPDIVRQAFDR